MVSNMQTVYDELVQTQIVEPIEPPDFSLALVRLHTLRRSSTKKKVQYSTVRLSTFVTAKPGFYQVEYLGTGSMSFWGIPRQQ
eukprot:SAG11_NODE_1561_length_4677_cov_2.447138_2_plen_83_part_00